MIERDGKLTVTRQAQLSGLSRASVYYESRGTTERDLRLMRRLDELHLRWLFCGSRKLAHALRLEGYDVGRRHVRTLMRKMGIEAAYRKSHTSIPAREATIYSYLLTGLQIERPNQVWSVDITNLPMAHGFLCLTGILDVFSRKALAWRLSNTMTADFCVEALEEALNRFGPPEIFNTDQGSRFTSEAWTSVPKQSGVAICTDGKGRWIDNAFIERLWRAVKYEDVYLHAYEGGSQARAGLTKYFVFYNSQRVHQGLDYQTPDAVYFAALPNTERKAA